MFTINQNLIDDFADKINEKEKKSNKVTSLSSSSTDTQYPSAKTVYDSLNNLHTSNIKIGGEPLTNIWTGATITSQATLNAFINNHIGEIDARLQKEEIVYGSIYKTDSSRVFISGTYNKVCDSVGSQHPFLNEMILFKLPNDLNSSSTKSIKIKVIYYTTSYTSSQNFVELPATYNNVAIKENTFASNTIILLKLNSRSNGFDVVGVFSPNSTGSYTDLTDKPTIPTDVSDLTDTTNKQFTPKSHTHTKSQITDFAHNHNDLYYTETETDTLLNGKLDVEDAFTGSYDDLSNKPSIPNASSDLSDGSDLVKKSSTTGLLKNDGGVMSSGTGSSNWAVGNHTHKNTVKTEITGGSLDNYTTTGWYSYSTTDSANITNVPVKVGSVMEVLDDYDNGQYIVQKVYPIQSDKKARIYCRIKYASNGWGKWEKVSNNGIVQGGKNVISTLPVTYNNSGVSITTDGETFHNETVYKSLLSEVSDTSKYSDIGFVIPYENFTYGDVFTLSFWAKGTSGKQIKTYFYGDSGYITVKRLSSNSTVSGNDTEYSGFNDGITTFELGSDWQFYTVTYKLYSTGTATANKKLAIRTFGGTDCSVACVQLERGEIATDYERPPLTQFSGLVSTACYVNLLQFEMTESYQNNPINIEISYKGRERPTQLQIRFSNTNLSASTNNVYTVSIFKSTQDQFTYYLRKVADNKYMLIGNKGANAWFNIHKIWNSNTGVKISIANTSYGTSAPTGSAPNLYVSTYAGVMDTELTWNGGATNNSVSPLLMAMDSEFGANRLAYFPSSRIKVEYSTDGGSTWTELTTGNYSEANKTKLVTTTSQYMYLGNGSTTDYSKNRLRITFDAGDMNVDSILYLVTRKIALFTGTANSTGFTCQIQIQTYAQYNSNSGTFSNYGSAFSLGGWSGWNTYPINFTLGGYTSANQTNSSSTRIKAIRLLFSQTGGTGNGIVSRVRLYGETAHRTTSQYANNNHIYTIDENQNATFPSKIIKEGGTSSQFLMANGDVQNKVTSWSNTPSDSNIASEKLVKDSLDQLGVIDLTSYTNNVSDYDANGISLSVTENNELYVTNGGDYKKPYHTKTFTNNDTYTIQFDIKQPSGTYVGKRFCILIGDPSNVLEISFKDYFVYVYLDGDIIGQISAIEISDYKTIRIHRNLNDWIFDYNNGEKTLTFRTSNDIPNKISYYGLGADEELYVKNVKLYANSIANNVNNIVDMIYPIGSIYMSVNSTSPQILFGGTWEKIEDTFLLASGTSYSNGATGGSATVSLSASQMPRHNHSTNSHYHTASESNEYYITSTSSGASNKRVTVPTSGSDYADVQSSSTFHHRTVTGSASPSTKYTGGTGSTEAYQNGSAHENMPPYLVVNVWKRTA